MSLQNILKNPHHFRKFDKPYTDGESPICVVCGHGADLHYCEICKTENKNLATVLFLTIRMCDAHYQQELAAQKELAEGAEQRVKESNAEFIKRAAEQTRKMLDESITIRSDYFNADIPALRDIKAEIFKDESLSGDEKQFKYVGMLKEHIGHMRQVLIDMRDAEMKIGARMKLMQSEINTEANKLREEERAALQIENINYTPVVPKVSKTPKAPTTKSSATRIKVDMKEVEALAKKYGVPEQTIMSTIRLKKLTPEAATREVVQAFARAGVSTSNQ